MVWPFRVTWMRCVSMGLGLRAELSVGLGGAETVFPASVMLGGPHGCAEWQGVGSQAEDKPCLCALVPSLPLSNLPATSAVWRF